MTDPPDTDPEGTTLAAPLGSQPGQAAASLQPAEVGPPLVAGRYEILGMIGAGGMGTVYRARDRELDEIVALKILKQELAAAPGMLERFRREVKLARRVTHRNVARTFDIGDHAGDRFLTMELIEGEMLGAHLARLGRVPVRSVIAIARDVCAGLAAAHAAGVLHRDLKPENVILAGDGRAVITDFGIARAVVQAELGRTVGGVIGTPAYMAPEQVEGAADLDGRADLYALGAMLFELLSGKPAWSGDSVIAIAAGRLLKPPPDVRTRVAEIPESLASLILKLMARSRDDRFATAAETDAALAALDTAELPAVRSLTPGSLGRALQGPSPTGAARVQRKVLAVLPLLNLGSEDDAYLAQTVTEDLVDLLSVVPELRVRPRGETVRFDDRSRDARDAGRQLGADVVVDGSLRRLGELVRVSVRLLTVDDGFQLWAQRFDGPPAHVLNVADDAASAIARALATERTAEARPVATDAVAQEMYLRGRYLLNRGWVAVSREGVTMLREAHERAPSDTRIAGAYALAVARILSSDANSAVFVNEARELAERTLERDPTQAEARVALGFIHLNSSEGEAAATQLKRALAVAPNSLEALDAVGRVLIEVGSVERGLATLQRALAIDPMMGQAANTIARAHALLGDLEMANDVLGPLPTDRADFSPYMLLKGRMALWHRDLRAAEEVQREVARSALASDPVRMSSGGVVAVLRSNGLSAAMLERLDAALPFGAEFPPRRIAFHAQLRVELRLGARDVAGALQDLRIADSNGTLDLLWLDRCPLFDELREVADFTRIRESTAIRAERVIRVLER